MKLNLRQPKYVLPIILLPFLCLFFYIWHSGPGSKKPAEKKQEELNGAVGQVSSVVRKENLQDKLDAFRNTFKEADGSSPVAAISPEKPPQLDSLRKAVHAKFGDRQAVEMLNHSAGQPKPKIAIDKPDDPMETFKKQMAYMDSLNKENDPAAKAERQKQQAAAKRKQLEADQKIFAVSKADAGSEGFNTVMPDQDKTFIKAVIDENMTGYAGSRLRLRLLDDIVAGKLLVPKDTYIYASISGFSEQRVTLSIKTILSSGKILPVKLEVYDLDGLPGLYVPASAFRDFSKDLGSSSIQGVDIGSGTTSFVMSAAGKMFQSTSSAIAGIIRKNKARMKYNSYIYLIDPDALQNAQKNY
ncbi:conjugative transposon protein TraM [Mucilaginibacter corticis]|uniref:Conjugative transposon protein TraM n=1 Tax=Mucilaginibacter corticis TaxID=2597670 RepID=A0A556MIG9_9SPHI|nr:conjugative transposon protein TraM [Mucilaginibacter corticis]TSJ39710.1 conjugative transposon protein TraM [Mucilaginibacter corticis]